MFRVFLKRKIESDQKDQENIVPRRPSRPSRKRNRRLFERYNISQQHMTIMNDQDILVVRDISAKGFSSDVSDRAYIRFNINDIYESRIRYMGELYDINMKVAWKKDKKVGFEIIDPSIETIKFLRRLLNPIEIATTLRKVNPKILHKDIEDKIWYHSNLDTDLFIWTQNTPEIKAWQLINGKNFIEWSYNDGFTTGKLEKQFALQMASGAHEKEVVLIRDQEIDINIKQFAADIIMAMNAEHKEDLLLTFEINVE